MGRPRQRSLYTLLNISYNLSRSGQIASTQVIRLSASYLQRHIVPLLFGKVYCLGKGLENIL
jgi:hypothetical protein